MLSHLQNYQHCYQADGEPLVRKHSPYEILNSTGVSAIRWYSHNGIYVMVATVSLRNTGVDKAYTRNTTIFVFVPKSILASYSMH